jgi:hypothetical protein
VRVFALIAVGALFGLVAGGGAAAPGYTRAQLAIMVLPKDALGADARGLEVSIGSGFTDNAAAAEDTTDPKDTGPQLGRAGRIIGYDLSYDDLSEATFARGSGLIEIDTSVDLFKSARSADAFLTKQVRDARRFRGKSVDFGVRLVASSTFAVGKIGDRAVGLRITGLLGGKRFYGTISAFRVGPLVASVSYSAADAKPLAAPVARLSRALAQRIRLASDGKLKARPVPVPPLGRKGRRPVGGPDLAPMALTRGDLPKGVTVSRQGYVDDRQSVGSYEREFDTSSARFGGSTVASLESDVSLLRTPTEAGGFFVILRALYFASGIQQDLAKAFGEGAGTKVGSVSIEQRPSLSAGDEAVALVARFSVNGTAVRIAFIHVRVKRVVGTLIVSGQASAFHFADVKPLAETVAKRIEGGL